MKNYKGFLIDIDGVLWEGDKPIAGAAETLRYLRAKGLPYVLVSGVTRFSKKEIVERLAGMGFELDENDVLPIRSVMIDYIKSRKLDARCYVIGVESIDEDFRAEGLHTTRKEEPVDFVVVGHDENLSYARLNTAFRLLMGGAELIGFTPGKYFSKNGELFINMGATTAALEYASGKKSVSVGKPNRQFFEAGCRKLNLKPEDVAMIGDSVEEDMVGAEGAGAGKILVRTGIYNEDLLRHSGVKPDLVLDSVADLPRHLAYASDRS